MPLWYHLHLCTLTCRYNPTEVKWACPKYLYKVLSPPPNYRNNFTLLNYNILVCVLLCTLIQCNVNPIVYAWCCVTVKVIYMSYISIITFINYYKLHYYTLSHSQFHKSSVCAYTCMCSHLEHYAFHHIYTALMKYQLIFIHSEYIWCNYDNCEQGISGVSADISTHLPCQHHLMAEYIRTLYLYTYVHVGR